MNYKMVDFSTWPRGDLFRFYMDHMRVVTIKPRAFGSQRAPKGKKGGARDEA